MRGMTIWTTTLCAATALAAGCLELPEEDGPDEVQPPASQDEAREAARAWMGDHTAGWFLEIERGAIERFSTADCDKGDPSTTFRVVTSRLELEVSFWCDVRAGGGLLRDVTVRRAVGDIDAPSWVFHVEPRATELAHHERGLVVDAHGVALELATTSSSVVGLDDAGACDDCAFELPFQAPMVARIELDRSELAPLLPPLR